MIIGIIFAMEEELNAFKEGHDFTAIKHKNLTVYAFKHENHQVYGVQSGIGKVNAASRTTWFLEQYKVDALINVGVAGGIEQDTETIVLGERVVYHDVDVTNFNYAYGQIPGMPAAFQSQATLLEKTENILKEAQFDYVVGTIASGDKFVTELKTVDAILNVYEDVYAIEMEAASIAHVAFLYDVPFLVIRSISDTLGRHEQTLMYETFLARASEKAARVLWALIKTL